MFTSRSHEVREAVIISSILLLAIQFLLVLKQPDLDSLIRDPDGFSWLNRVMLLHTSGDWFNATDPRISPPEGLAQHWSRPFDVVLYTGAWIGSRFVPFKDALFGWSLALGPILQIISLVALFWAFRPVMKGTDYLVLGFLYVTQMGIVTTYSFGRPDHQQLLNILFIISIGLTTRILMRPLNIRLCLLAGFISALGIWVSVETLLVVLAVYLCLGGLWLFGTRGLTRKVCYYSSSLALFSIVFLFLEKGHSAFSSVEIDKLSIAFISLLTAISVFWWTVLLLENGKAIQQSAVSRFTLSLIGSLLIIGIMEVFFPGFFSGPAAGVDNLYNETRRLKILEARPLVDFGDIASGNWKAEFVRFSYWMGLIIPAIPVIVLKLVKEPNPGKLFWIFIATTLLIYIPDTFIHLRWIHYAVIILLLPYAFLVSAVLGRVDAMTSGLLASVLRILVILLSAGVFILPGYIFPEASVASEDPQSGTMKRCEINSIVPLLNKTPGPGESQKKILAFVDYGPEILFRTDHSVYSIPSHRYQTGYTVSYQMMNSSTDEEALCIIESNTPDYILICPNDMKTDFYGRKDRTETFYQHLANKSYPSWINEVENPFGNTDFILLEVNK